jgi:pimeloyl-ACP methyl ester carboxylesterase
MFFRHGGPGGGTSARDRRYFDPAVYRIVVFDQRGAGQSKPPAELRVCQLLPFVILFSIQLNEFSHLKND